MSQKEKLIKRFKERPKDFTWEELTVLLKYLGYEVLARVTTSGSRRRFAHPDAGIISLHEPHPKKILKSYQVALVLEQLEKENLL